MLDNVGIMLPKLTLQYSELRLCTLSHIQLDFLQFVFTFCLSAFKQAWQHPTLICTFTACDGIDYLQREQMHSSITQFWNAVCSHVLHYEVPWWCV